jgi:KEOPS complex subunit Pcc1
MTSREASGDGAAHGAVIDFDYADERRARTVAESVLVEVGAIADERSRAAVERDGCAVRIDIEAADLVALRAGLNTWLRLVGVAEDVATDASSRADGVRTGTS